MLPALLLLPATASSFSPPDPVTGARSIAIVASLVRETKAVPSITKGYLETHLRDYLVEQIAAPADGNYHSRPDFPVRILDEQSFYAGYESNYDVVLICKFRLADTGAGVESTFHVLSFACAYDFFDSDEGVLTTYTRKTLRTSSVLVDGKGDDKLTNVVNRLQRDFLDELVARVRGQTGRNLVELHPSEPGAAARLFNGVKVIGRSAQPCLYNDCMTKNPVVRNMSSAAIGRDVLFRSLTQSVDLPGQPRPEVTIIDPGEPIDPKGGSARILFEMFEVQDLRPIGSVNSITIATVAYAFATRYSPGGEMFVSEPHAFAVASDGNTYRRQLELQYGQALREIVERLRLAQ